MEEQLTFDYLTTHHQHLMHDQRSDRHEIAWITSLVFDYTTLFIPMRVRIERNAIRITANDFATLFDTLFG